MLVWRNWVGILNRKEFVWVYKANHIHTKTANTSPLHNYKHECNNTVHVCFSGTCLFTDACTSYSTKMFPKCWGIQSFYCCCRWWFLMRFFLKIYFYLNCVYFLLEEMVWFPLFLNKFLSNKFWFRSFLFFFSAYIRGLFRN